MVCDDAAVEAEDGCGILGHAVVRPSCEVKLSHLQRAFRATGKLCLYVCVCVCVHMCVCVCVHACVCVCI